MTFLKRLIGQIVFTSVICTSFFLQGLWDLEEKLHDFVLETRQIEIPGYPYAFNPSIIRWKDTIVMSFRDIPDPKNTFHSRIGIILLDQDFNPISSPQILDTQWEDPFPICAIPSRSEDARLITVGEKLYMVYSDNKNEIITGAGFRVYIAELKYDGNLFTVYHNECLSEYPNMNPNRREKSWTPFDYKGDLLLAYSLQPHFIFRPLLGTGKCGKEALSQGNINWNWGELRGGTPGLLLDNEYLSFFHSTIKMPSVQTAGKVAAHYFMGAYTYSAEPPFEITKISPEPIFGKGFYTGKEYPRYWGTIKAIFPCGYIYDENYLWISYGKQDHEIWITKLGKNALLDSLVPVINDKDIVMENSDD